MWILKSESDKCNIFSFVVGVPRVQFQPSANYPPHNRTGPKLSAELGFWLETVGCKSTMALKSVTLGFQFPLTPPSFASPKLRKERMVFRCTQAEQISFTESEKSLIEALLGIQGRGRSSSPEQLNVSLSLSLSSSFFSLIHN